MSNVLIAIFWVECFAILAWGFLDRRRLLTFPVLAAAVFGAFIGIPLLGLERSALYSEVAVQRVSLMAVFSLAACWLGSRFAPKPRLESSGRFSDDRLRSVSAVLTLAGAVAFLGIKALPEELTSQRQWTGSPVAYLFFAQILAYGFAISMLDFLRTGSRWSLVVALVGAAFYLDRVILDGRRGPAAEFLSILACSVWFARNWSPPRWLAGLSIGLMVAALYSISEYRSAVVWSPERHWSEVAEIQPGENVQAILEHGSPELENALMSVDATADTGTYDFGLFHWNTLVFNYVPAQVFGEQFKNSLVVPIQDEAYYVHGYTGRPGATSTGLVDAFGSFWYFGAAKFFLIGLIMSWLLARARGGDFPSQLAYMLMLTNSLHAITHHTQWFVSPWVHMGLFLLPCLLLARKPRPHPARPDPKSKRPGAIDSPAPRLAVAPSGPASR